MSEAAIIRDGAAARRRWAIPHSRPTLDEHDRRAVAEAVASGTLVGGERLARFERDLAHALARREAVAVVSGSAALHLALAALGAGPGTEVALPSYACISLLQAARRTGADPVLVDCDPSSFNLDPDDLARRLTPRTRAIVVVHTFGMPAEIEAVTRLGVAVVEDVATALGARRRGVPVGSEGACAVGSFNATKMITTGGGGAVWADDPQILADVADRVDYDHGRDAAVRYNERLGEIAAALGISQLERLEAFVERRRSLARIYRDALSASAVVLPREPAGCEPAWHRFVVRVAAGAERIRARLAERGIASPPPVREPLHRIVGRADCPGAETAWREALSLPLYPSLDDDDARRIAQEVLQCLGSP